MGGPGGMGGMGGPGGMGGLFDDPEIATLLQVRLPNIPTFRQSPIKTFEVEIIPKLFAMLSISSFKNT